MSVTELITQALELPVQDRAELISAVFDSIDNFEDTNENDLYNEALKRDQDIEQGVVRPLSYEEFMAGFSDRNASYHGGSEETVTGD